MRTNKEIEKTASIRADNYMIYIENIKCKIKS